MTEIMTDPSTEIIPICVIKARNKCRKTDLVDAFENVPLLLEVCANTWDAKGAGIRALRLVSKDLAVVAITLVKSCSVQLGHGAFPDPQHMTRLMRHAALQQMDVTVVIRAGNVGSTSSQLVTCTEQTTQLITTLSSAITGLARLHLTVRLVWHNSPRLLSTVDSSYDDESSKHKYKEGVCIMHSEEGKPNIARPVSCPAHLDVLPQRVFEILSAAMPRLQHLSLLGHCSGSVLDAFGPSCSQLHSLRVEASSVSVLVLTDLHVNLPKLTHFSLFKRGNRGNNLKQFTLAAFLVLGPCTSLTNLELDFNSKVEIACKAPAWKLLPPGIVELRSTGPLVGLRQAGRLLATLETLDVLESPYEDLLELLRHAPCLQSLSVQQKKHISLDIGTLYNVNGSYAHDMMQLREQVSTMAISCRNIKIRASSTNLAAVMTWLRPISATSLTLEVTSLEATPFDALDNIAYVFPRLSFLELVDKIVNPDPQVAAASLSEVCLGPVVDCQLLKKLLVRMHFPLTTSGMFHLCLCLPGLEKLQCFRCAGLHHKDLEQTLQLTRPSFELNIFSNP